MAEVYPRRRRHAYPGLVTCVLLAALLAAAPAWKTAAPGLDTLSVEEGGDRVTLVRFDLGRFRPEVVFLGPGGVRTAAALRRERAATAAINGGFFDQDGRSLGLRVAGGKTMTPLRRGLPASGSTPRSSSTGAPPPRSPSPPARSRSMYPGCTGCPTPSSSARAEPPRPRLYW